MTAEGTSAPPTWQGRGADIAVALLFAYFAARLLALALLVDGSVPPDEATHVVRAQAFATVWTIPASEPDNYALGLISHRPFLYSWLMARVLDVNVFPIPDWTFLRLANVDQNNFVVFQPLAKRGGVDRLYALGQVSYPKLY